MKPKDVPAAGEGGFRWECQFATGWKTYRTDGTPLRRTRLKSCSDGRTTWVVQGDRVRKEGHILRFVKPNVLRDALRPRGTRQAGSSSPRDGSEPVDGFGFRFMKPKVVRAAREGGVGWEWQFAAGWKTDRTDQAARSVKLRRSTRGRSGGSRNQGGSMCRGLASRGRPPVFRRLPGERCPPGRSPDSSDGCAAAGPGPAESAWQPNPRNSAPSNGLSPFGRQCRFAPHSPCVATWETAARLRRHHPALGTAPGARPHPGETIAVPRGQTAEGRSSLSLLQRVIMTREVTGSVWRRLARREADANWRAQKIVAPPPACKIYRRSLQRAGTGARKEGKAGGNGGGCGMDAVQRFPSPDVCSRGATARPAWGAGGMVGRARREGA